MYRQHWGLERRPFQDDATSDFFFRSDSYQSALLKLQYLIDNRLGVGLISGPTGCGKSTLLRELPRSLSESAGPVVEVAYPRMSPRELLHFIAGEISRRDDFQGTDLPLDRTVAALAKALNDFTRQQRHPVIVIDDAHTIDEPAVFEAFQLLLNLRKPGVCDFSLIFAGEPALLPRLNSFPGLVGRIVVKAIVRPLTVAETAAYVKHRLRVGGTTEDIFDTNTLRCIHELTGGVPLQVNHLCELSLLVGYADRSASVHIEQVMSVAEELPALAGAMSQAAGRRDDVPLDLRPLRR